MDETAKIDPMKEAADEADRLIRESALTPSHQGSRFFDRFKSYVDECNVAIREAEAYSQAKARLLLEHKSGKLKDEGWIAPLAELSSLPRPAPPERP
jgi:hypothetical protein